MNPSTTPRWFTPISSKPSSLNKTSCFSLPVLCVACENPRCETSYKDLPSKQRCDSICRRMNTVWPVSLKPGIVECLKNPRIPKMLTDSRGEGQSQQTNSYGLEPALLSAVQSFPPPCDTDLAQWEVDKSAKLGTRDRLRMKAGFSFFFPFLFCCL